MILHSIIWEKLRQMHMYLIKFYNFTMLKLNLPKTLLISWLGKEFHNQSYHISIYCKLSRYSWTFICYHHHR